MIQVHHLEKSRSNRIVWLLEELGAEYQVVTYHRDPKSYGAPAELKKVYPLGVSPVITDGEVTVAESGAIIEYLLDHYDPEQRYRPAAGQSLLDYRYWMHFAEGSLMPFLVMQLILSKSKKRVPFFIRPVIGKFVDALYEKVVLPRLTPQLQLIDDFLAVNHWFAGEHLSGADFQMFLSLQLAAMQADISSYTHIQRYMQEVKGLQSYQRAEKQF
ncbi:glutathionine S-transferase [Vibrio aerogenes CECT 7868]|uniref:glutathione transferase n=1 Tax=Vibrio aerogenes CECT 7868 TaxID=1216006 RepID=A0A1M5UDU5_9VIBR|nr:glutathione S-transferase [Vibrio aerogenes]SHH60823.1 glutathionine S-transferase [Vibrio aerogenes CECT 7868]